MITAARKELDSPLTPVNSEAVVLGAMILDRTCLPSVQAVLGDGTCFYLTEHRILYAELLAWARGNPPAWDLVALRGRLQARRRYEAVGGTRHLGRIMDYTVGSATAVYYAQQVRRGYAARQAAAVAAALQRQLQDGCDIAEQLQTARRRLTALAAACGTPAGDRLEAVTAASIVPQALTWFWPNRIPAGMYSFIVGDPGAGKSFLSCYLAAAASVGGAWADGTPVGPDGTAMDVLMFITEDDLARTVVPRLAAHGADLARIRFCRGVHVGGREQAFDIARNMDLLLEQLETMDRCGLILFDPVTGFMGDANQNSQAEVRSVLGRVCRLAEDRQITVIGLSHLNKKVDLDLRHRSIGSVAFNAVPRAVWGVFAADETDGDANADARTEARSGSAGMGHNGPVPHPLDSRLRGNDNSSGNGASHSCHPRAGGGLGSPMGSAVPLDSRLRGNDYGSGGHNGKGKGNDNHPPAVRTRYFFPIKDNLCIEPTALAFTLAGGRVQFGQSLRPGQLKAALNPDKHPPPRLTKKEQAKQAILDLLKQGPVPSDRLIAAVTANGISEQTVRYARKELRDAGKVDCDNPNGGGYHWFLRETL